MKRLIKQMMKVVWLLFSVILPVAVFGNVWATGGLLKAVKYVGSLYIICWLITAFFVLVIGLSVAIIERKDGDDHE